MGEHVHVETPFWQDLVADDACIGEGIRDGMWAESRLLADEVRREEGIDLTIREEGVAWAEVEAQRVAFLVET